MMKKILLSSLLLSFTFAATMSFAGTPSGEMMANTCAGCHGPNGISNGPATPTIAGISNDYFIETMMAYKTGERPSTIMTRIAKGYSEEEIGAMAAHFSKIKFVSSPQSYDKLAAKNGKKLHNKYCEKCHEDGGMSTEDDAGILAGQWMPYLKYSLSDFTSGNREMEKKMGKKLKQLQEKHGDEGLEKLMQFYASHTKSGE